MNYIARLNRNQFDQIRHYLSGEDRTRHEDDATNPFEVNTVQEDGTLIRLVVYEGSDIAGTFVEGRSGHGEYWMNRSFVFYLVEGNQLYWIDELSGDAFVEGTAYRLDEDGNDFVRLVVE